MKPTEAIQRTIRVIRRQHKALATEETYLYWLQRYIAALAHMSAGLSSEQKLERFLTDLARRRDLSASSQNQAFNAIHFFYRDVLGQPNCQLSIVNCQLDATSCTPLLNKNRLCRARHKGVYAEFQVMPSWV